MNRFYSEMKDIIDELPNKDRVTSISSNFQAQDSGILLSYFPKMFAEGLVPMNPRHWLVDTFNSAATSDMPDFQKKITSLNIISTLEYLDTSYSDVQYRD